MKLTWLKYYSSAGVRIIRMMISSRWYFHEEGQIALAMAPMTGALRILIFSVRYEWHWKRIHWLCESSLRLSHVSKASLRYLGRQNHLRFEVNSYATARTAQSSDESATIFARQLRQFHRWFPSTQISWALKWPAIRAESAVRQTSPLLMIKMCCPSQHEYHCWVQRVDFACGIHRGQAWSILA